MWFEIISNARGKNSPLRFTWVMRRKLYAIKRRENPLVWERELKCEDSICTSICKLLFLSEEKIMYARIHETSAGLCRDNKQKNNMFQALCLPVIYKCSSDCYSGKTNNNKSCSTKAQYSNYTLSELSCDWNQVFRLWSVLWHTGLVQLWSDSEKRDCEKCYQINQIWIYKATVLSSSVAVVTVSWNVLAHSYQKS